MASLRDCKSSNLPRVTGISFLLFKWDVAWRNFEVNPLKKLANRIHVSIFSIFFSKKNLRIVVRHVCPSLGASICRLWKIFHCRVNFIFYWPINLKFGLNIGCGVVHVRKAYFFMILIAICKFMQLKTFLQIDVCTRF